MCCHIQHMRAANYYKVIHPEAEPALPDFNDFSLLDLFTKDVQIALLKMFNETDTILSCLNSE